MINQANKKNCLAILTIPIGYYFLANHPLLLTAFFGFVSTYLAVQVANYGIISTLFTPEPAAVEEIFNYIRNGDLDGLKKTDSKFPPFYLN